MNRREFVNRLGLVGASILSSHSVFAGTRCLPFTPAGVQQCESGIDSSILEVVARDVRGQHASEWCWAAGIETIFAYYGFRLPQEQIVAETWGGIVNMPGQPDQILADLNRQWTDRRGRTFQVAGESYDANPVTAAQDLAQNMPLIIGTLGHAMVLTSLVYVRDGYGNGQVQQAIVRDPWPGRGRRMLTPQEWYSTSFLARIRVQSD